MSSISAALRAVPEQTPEPEPAAPTSTHLIDMLFIDCMPLHPLDAPITSSYDLLAKANREVADDAGVHNALLIDFGKGPIMIAAEIRAMLEAEPVKYLAWESRSTEGRACLTTLVPLAKTIIKGMY